MSQTQSKLARRTLFAGAGTAGALAVTASLLPGAAKDGAPLPTPLKAPPDRGGGYQLTDHVRQYYKTTLV